jgi:hypothetical protein
MGNKICLNRTLVRFSVLLSLCFGLVVDGNSQRALSSFQEDGFIEGLWSFVSEDLVYTEIIVTDQFSHVMYSGESLGLPFEYLLVDSTFFAIIDKVKEALFRIELVENDNLFYAKIGDSRVKFTRLLNGDDISNLDSISETGIFRFLDFKIKIGQSSDVFLNVEGADEEIIMPSPPAIRRGE